MHMHAHACTHTHTHTHTRTHAHARAHTRTHVHTRAMCADVRITVFAGMVSGQPATCNIYLISVICGFINYDVDDTTLAFFFVSF